MELLQPASHELQPFIHHRTLLPRHHSLPKNRRKCYPCVRYDVLPMSQAAHRSGPETWVRRKPLTVASSAFSSTCARRTQSLTDIALASTRRTGSLWPRPASLFSAVSLPTAISKRPVRLFSGSCVTV